MTPFTVVNAGARGAVVVTCEHASCAVPPEYGNLGLPPDQVKERLG